MRIEKGKCWYVKAGWWYEGSDLCGIYDTYKKAKQRYDDELKRYNDYVQLWVADLDTQEYSMLEEWDRDGDD